MGRMDRFEAFLSNHFLYSGAEPKGECVLVRLQVGAEIRPVTLPRRYVTLLPPNEILIPQWLCEEKKLTHGGAHGKSIV